MRFTSKQQLAFLLVGIYLVVCGASYFFASRVMSRKKVVVTPQGTIEVVSVEKEEPPLTFALLGYGGAGHAGGSLTDSMLVAYVNEEAKRVTLFSLPRDLWVSIPERADQPPVYRKINAAYAIGADDNRYPNKPEEYQGTHGGGALAKHVIEQVLGFPVTYYIAVDFSGFTQAIDTLGGVTVNVPRAFADPYYPIAGKEDDPCGRTPEEIAATVATLSGALAEQEFGCRYEVLSFPAGPAQLDGVTALKFVRSRHSAVDGSDFGRAARQRALLLAVRDKALSLNILPKIPSLLSTLSSHVHTDIGLLRMQSLLLQFPQISEYPVESVGFTTGDNGILRLGRSADGQSIVVPKDSDTNWESVHAWVQTHLEGTATSSAQLSE